MTAVPEREPQTIGELVAENVRQAREIARLRAVLELVKQRTRQRDLNHLIAEALGYEVNPLTAQLLREIEAER